MFCTMERPILFVVDAVVVILDEDYLHSRPDLQSDDSKSMDSRQLVHP